MQRRRRKKSGAVNYRVINGDSDGGPEPEESGVSDQDLNAYLTWLSSSSNCRALVALPDVVSDDWSLEQSFQSPLLLKRGSLAKQRHGLLASHPLDAELLAALDGRTLELSSSTGPAGTTVSLAQWQLYMKSSAGAAHPDGPRPLKRLCKAGDVAGGGRTTDGDSAATKSPLLPAVFSSPLPLYATTEVGSLEGFAVPEAVAARSAIPGGDVGSGEGLQATMQAVFAAPCSSADFDLHPTGAACWWQQLSGQRVVVAAPPLPSNVAAWRDKHDGEPWGGPLGGQLRGLVAAQLSGGESVFLPAGWLIAHTVLPHTGIISGSRGDREGSSNTALKGTWQPVGLLAAQLAAWQARGGLANQSAQSAAFVDYMWRTVVVIRAHLKAVARLSAADLTARADETAQQRASSAAAVAAAAAAARSHREEAAAVRRRSGEVAAAQRAQRAAEAAQRVASPLPRSRRRKPGRPLSAAAPSDALPFLSPSTPQGATGRTTKLKIRVGGAAMGVRPTAAAGQPTTPSRQRGHTRRRVAATSDDDSSERSGEVNWSDLARNPATLRRQGSVLPPPAAPAQPLLEHQVRTRGGRVASRVIVNFDDTKSAASSSASRGGDNDSSSSSENDAAAPQRHGGELPPPWSEASGAVAAPRVTVRFTPPPNSIPQVDGADDSDDDNDRAPPDATAASVPQHQPQQGAVARSNACAAGAADRADNDSESAFAAASSRATGVLCASSHLDATPVVGQEDASANKARGTPLPGHAGGRDSNSGSSSGPPAALLVVRTSTSLQEGTEAPPPLQQSPLCAASPSGEASVDTAPAAVTTAPQSGTVTDSRSREPATVAPLRSPLPLLPPRVVVPGTSMHKKAVEGIEIVAVKKRRPMVSIPKPRSSNTAAQVAMAAASKSAAAQLGLPHTIGGIPSGGAPEDILPLDHSAAAPVATYSSNHSQKPCVMHAGGEQSIRMPPYSMATAAAAATVEQAKMMGSSSGSHAARVLVDAPEAAIEQQMQKNGSTSLKPLFNRLGTQTASLDLGQGTDGQPQPSESWASAVKQEPSIGGGIDMAMRGGAGTCRSHGAGGASTPLESHHVPTSDDAAASPQLLATGEAVSEAKDQAEVEVVGRGVATSCLGMAADGRAADDVSRWQAAKPSWLPVVAHAYENDAGGVGALLAAAQEWLDAGQPPPTFVCDAQRLVDELGVCIDAAEVVLPDPPLQNSAAAGKMLRRLQTERNHHDDAIAHGSDVEYTVPSQGTCQSNSNSNSITGFSSGSGSPGRHNRSRRGAAASSSGLSLRRLKRPNSGVLSPVGAEEAADSVHEARALGGMQAGRHAGLPGLAGLTAKKPSVKSRLIKKLRLH